MAVKGLDLSKFKKIKAESHKVTLRHPDGHEFHIATNALSPALKKQIHALPFAEGGKVVEVNTPEPNEQQSIVDKENTDARNAVHQQKGEDFEPYSPEVNYTMSKAQKMADGGQVTGQGGGQDKLESTKKENYGRLQIRGKNQSSSGVRASNEDDNGVIYAADGVAVNQDGSATSPDDTEDQSDHPPVSININTPHQMQDVPPSMQKASPMENAAAIEAAPNYANPQQKVVAQQQLADQAMQNQPKNAPLSPIQNPSLQTQSIPDALHGYQEQLTGVAGQAAASGSLGQIEAKTMRSAVSDQKAALKTYQDARNEGDTERQAILKDIQNGHIDPEAYWQDHSKILSGIGLVLAGFNPAGKPNAALGFLQNQIDNNIKAQQMNLESEHNLLRNNLERYGNMQDATTMTRIMSADMLHNMLGAAAAQSQNPQAQANAQQVQGQLEQQFAPQYQQLLMRQALQKGSQQNVDPASYVPYVVPEADRKEVFKEIGNAQAAAQNRDEIASLFDKSVQEQSVVSRIGNLGRTPPSISRMEALFLPMIHDAEGRVNEFEKKTLDNLMPAVSDFGNPERIAAKRAGLMAFINAKLQAPTAKGYSIDLSKFRSTSTNPAVQNPEIARWAQQNINSKDPQTAQKAQMAARKLGLLK